MEFKSAGRLRRHYFRVGTRFERSMQLRSNRSTLRRAFARTMSALRDWGTARFAAPVRFRVAAS